LKIGKDGSVYLGHRMRTISELKVGSKSVVDGEVNITYEEGTIISDPELLKR